MALLPRAVRTGLYEHWRLRGREQQPPQVSRSADRPAGFRAVCLHRVAAAVRAGRTLLLVLPLLSLLPGSAAACQCCHRRRPVYCSVWTVGAQALLGCWHRLGIHETDARSRPFISNRYKQQKQLKGLQMVVESMPQSLLQAHITVVQSQARRRPTEAPSCQLSGRQNGCLCAAASLSAALLPLSFNLV